MYIPASAGVICLLALGCDITFDWLVSGFGVSFAQILFVPKGISFPPPNQYFPYFDTTRPNSCDITTIDHPLSLRFCLNIRECDTDLVALVTIATALSASLTSKRNILI